MTSNHQTWFRQIGILDQQGVASLRKSVDGDDDGIMAMLVLSSQLGAFRSDQGFLRINREPDEEIRAELVRGLTHPFPSDWKQASEIFESLGMDIRVRRLEEDSDIWIGKPPSTQLRKSAGLWMIHGNGRAICGIGSMEEIPIRNVPSTMIDAPTLMCGVSSLVHRLLDEEGLFWKVPISDRWLTLTARVDELTPEQALESISSSFGHGTSTSLADGSGSLIRFRIPLEETPSELLESIDQPRNPPRQKMKIADVGPFPAVSDSGEVSFHGKPIPAISPGGNFFVLGAGGTGSWASTMILSGCAPDSNLTIVDGDNAVEDHNLNRQVLYQERDLGLPKATAAKISLSRMFPDSNSRVLAIPGSFGPRHAMQNHPPNQDDLALEEIIGDDAENDEAIISSLGSMDVALSCLDNQLARTWLNRACLDRGKTMVNGGSEGERGVVETFADGSCMVCRYGEAEANSSEVVSCQEEGTRPVPSIVTSTAYVGSMMAAIALCVVASEKSVMQDIPQDRDWCSGETKKRTTGRLPWYDSSCSSHL